MSSYDLASVISDFHESLAGHYPPEEINSLIFLTFEHVAGLSRTDLVLRANDELPSDQYVAARDILHDLQAGRPIQYILGRAHFYDLVFEVTGDVLIPRPETEELVDWIVKDDPGRRTRLLDVGTGSGCIAVALSDALPDADVTAVDVSDRALGVARRNARNNHAAVRFARFDVLSEEIFPGAYDVVVSNPPYVTEEGKALLKRHVREHEPGLALFVTDDDPLQFYKAVAGHAEHWLGEGGRLYFELNERQGPETAAMLEDRGFTGIELRQDIHGKDRLLRALRHPA